MKYLLVVASVICLFGLSVLGALSESTAVINSLREKRSPQRGPPPPPCDPNDELPCEPPMPPPSMAQMNMPKPTMNSAGLVSGKKSKRAAEPPQQGQKPPGGGMGSGMGGAMDGIGSAMGGMASTMVDAMGSVASGAGGAMSNMGKRMENMG